jgi:Protein of unknown function (DUF4230)
MTVTGLIGMGVGMEIAKKQRGIESSSSHSPPTIQQVQALASLITQRVEVSDVQETELAGCIGGIRAALLIKGDFLLGTDLSGAKFESVDPIAHKAVLVLTQPRVTSPRLDQNRTRLFALSEHGLWLITPDDRRTTTTVVNRAYNDGQNLIGRAADDPRLLASCRAQAELVLATFFRAIGWDISVRWAD